MRPRAGDFLYTQEEIDLLCRQITALRAAGADGFVIGALTPAGDLDLPAMRALLDACGGAPVTLHRCIDVSRDLCGTYRAAAALGIDTVLTSGGAESCRKGTTQLAALLRLRDTLNGPEILIGAGVSAAVIDELRAALPGRGPSTPAAKNCSPAAWPSGGRAFPWACPDWTSGTSSRPMPRP